MLWGTLYWMVIKGLSNSDVLSSLCGLGSGERKKRERNILPGQEGSALTPSPLPTVYDPGRGNKFSNLERETLCSCARDTLSLRAEKKILRSRRHIEQR